MIIVVHNEVLNAPEILIDDDGIDELIRVLSSLKREGDHTHLATQGPAPLLADTSPYGHQTVHHELIISSIPSPEGG